MRFLFFLCLLVTSSVSIAEPKVSATMLALPSDIRIALQGLCRGCAFADSNAPWESTDVVTDSLPRRRFSRIEHIGDEWRIEYEHGGRGLHSHTIVFSTNPKLHVVSTSSCIPSKTCHEW